MPNAAASGQASHDASRPLSRWTLFAFALPAAPISAMGLPLVVHLPPFYAGTLGLGLVTVGAVVSLVSPVAPDDDPPLQADRKSGANNDRHRGHRVAVVLSMFIVFSPCACGNFVLFFYCC
mgnify:CR=1 FL=1